MSEEILEMTQKFHDTYEKLASEYAYKTREDTKVFDINSNNGKLMYATVNKIVSPILKENQDLKKQLHDASIQIQELIEKDIWCPSNCEKLEKLQKENKKIQKQLEETNKTIEKCGFVNIEQVMLSYCGLITQQKEFIEWLEDKIQQQETVIAENQEKSYFLIYDDAKEDLKLSSQKAYIRKIIFEEILQKYREVTGLSDEKK
nr:MAG TPA: hypothetical protein [Bacteriophage sp.]